MGGSDARRRGGFLRGALTGLAVSALALAAWSLNTPLAQRGAALAPEAAQNEAPSVTVVRAAPAAAAPAAQSADQAASSTDAPASEVEATAAPEAAPEAAPKVAAAPAAAGSSIVAEPVAQSGAESAAESAAVSAAQAAAEPAPEPAPEPAADATASRAPESSAPPAAQPAPPEPAWRRNAEAFDARGAAPVAVALSGIDAVLLERALALGAPLTLVIDAAAPDASALIARARAAGCEVVTLGGAADPHAVGVAAPVFDADALHRVRAEGLLTLALETETPSPDGVAAAFRLEGDASAERVFQTLQEAARRAAPGDGVVVALAASDAALTGLARWLAVTDAAPAPLSAVAVGR